MSRRRRWVAGTVIALAALAVIVVAHAPLLRLIGAALVVEDPLAPSDAIVVLAGGTPFREATAASLFRDGWASRVILSRPFTPRQHRALVELGVRPHDYQAEAQLSLEKYGVPSRVIIALREPVKITEDELALVHRFAMANGYRRVILVSAAEHTRRVKLIWSRQEGEGKEEGGKQEGETVEGIVIPLRDEPPAFAPDRWWLERRMAEAVLHEYLGILAIYLGIAHLMT